MITLPRYIRRPGVPCLFTLAQCQQFGSKDGPWPGARLGSERMVFGAQLGRSCTRHAR